MTQDVLLLSYCVLSALLGVMSNVISGRRSTILGCGLVAGSVAATFVGAEWRDFTLKGAFNQSIYYLFPFAGMFLIPFIAGRYSGKAVSWATSGRMLGGGTGQKKASGTGSGTDGVHERPGVDVE